MMEQPNLLFIFPDQMRRQAMGCMNQDPVLTPRLDEFASESVLFTHALSTFPVCSPYRASLLTGQYPHGHGVLTNCRSDRHGLQLSEQTTCLTDVLSDAGYSVGWIGKWHLDAPHAPYVGTRSGDGHWWNEYTPSNRRHGIQFWYGSGCNNDHLHPSYWVQDGPRESSRQVDEWSLQHETNVALRYLRNETGHERDPQKPFALFVSWNPPHPPYRMVPEQYLAAYEGLDAHALLTRGNVDGEAAADARAWVKHYFAAITGLDGDFGRIMNCLKEQSLEQNTLVVFTSDHGDMMGSHGLMGKTVHWEESIGVPLIMRWPDRIMPRRDDLLFAGADLMPTLLGMMNLNHGIPSSVQGVDYSSTLLFGEGPRPQSALYMRPCLKHPWDGDRGVITHRWKLLVQRDTTNGQRGERRWLGDLETDPLENENHLSRHPAVEREMKDRLNDWLRRTNDPWEPAS